MPGHLGRLMRLNAKGCLVETLDTPPCAVLVISRGHVLLDVILESIKEERELFLRVHEWMRIPRPPRRKRSFVAEEIRKHLLSEGIPDYSDVILNPVIGTDFQRRVWEVTRSVPYGETRSYKWLAELAGSPRAYRAAASAMAKNPFPLVVPCHRIIASDGALGGFGGGLDLKRALLQLERSHSRRQLRR